MKTYNDVVQFLEGFINYERQLDSLAYDPKTFNLESFRSFVGGCGNPQDRITSIHIAGTKGKGSVAAMLEAALRGGGLRTGLYTSPHLTTYLERFRLAGCNISEEKFVSCMNILRCRLEESIPQPTRRYRTVFELLTALAFLYFRDEKVDIAIFETGLGGRLDATNVVRPILSIITSLGKDHTNLLGTTISDIAREKGGIIKEETPVIISLQGSEAAAEALPVIYAICAEKHAPLIRAEERVRFIRGEHVGQDMRGGVAPCQRLYYAMPDGKELEINIPLIGHHQAENARTALTALDVLRERGLCFNFGGAVEGFSAVHWPGRIEIVRGEPPIIIDGAHCPLSAAALRETLGEWYPNRRRVLLLGILKGKDVPGIFKEFARDPLLAKVITFTPPTPRGLGAEILAEMLKPAFPDVVHASSIENAIQTAMENGQGDTLVVVTGSLYNIAPAKNFLGLT